MKDLIYALCELGFVVQPSGKFTLTDSNSTKHQVMVKAFGLEHKTRDRDDKVIVNIYDDVQELANNMFNYQLFTL